MTPLLECLRQLALTAAYLRQVGRRHEQWAEIWARHLEDDAKSLRLLAEVLVDDAFDLEVSRGVSAEVRARLHPELE